MFEVHAVDADEEGEGDKDGGEYGEDFHDVVGVFGDVGVVAVLLVGEHGVVDFDGFDRLDDEGVEVAEVFAGGGGDEVGVGAEEPGDGLFDGTDVFAEVGEFGFVAVGVLDEFAAGGEEFFFLFFDDVAEFFDGEDVVVHERVDEGVAEVVGGVFAYFPLAAVEASADVVEAFAVGFLEGEEVVPAEDEGDLFDVHFSGGAVEAEGFEDEVEVAGVFGVFGAFVRVEDVFEGEGVDGEASPEVADEVGVVESLEGNPGAVVAGDAGGEEGGGTEILFLDAIGGVAGDEEAGAFDFLFADKNEGAGGGAAGELFVFEESCHVFFVCGESGQR